MDLQHTTTGIFKINILSGIPHHCKSLIFLVPLLLSFSSHPGDNQGNFNHKNSLGMTQNALSPLIKPEELKSVIDKHDVILIDASNSPASKERYLKEHLDGALHVDLNKQLSDIKSDFAMGGRHPLPTPSQFAATLAEWGITPDSHVIVYDDKNAANAAARFWWMLNAIGHNKIQVLDGGFQAAVKAGFPVNADPVTAKKVSPYPAKDWKFPIADISLIDKASKDKSYVIVDVREQERYNGEKEPIDLIAGHIPNAVNVPFASNLNSDGSYLSSEALKLKYSKVFEGVDAEKVIIHCGSGVTACHTILAMASAGFEIPKLYVGSWSEWSRNDRPMETLKKEKE